MAKTKYFDKIIADQQFDAAHPGPPLPPFDFADLAPGSRVAQLVQRALERAIPLLLWLARKFFPVFRFNGFYWVSRHADVVAALANSDALEVPYGPEMRELSRGANGEADFVLGVDGAPQQRQNAIIRRVILDTDLPRIRDWSRAFSESLIEGGAGRLDVVGDLSIRVPTEICRRYFGLSFTGPTRFAEWAIAISAFLFADPTGDPVKRRLGLAGAARLRRIIDAAIARAGGDTPKQAPADFATLTLVERLVRLAQNEPALGLRHAEIRAIVLGLIVGFIPTNGLAAAKMLELLFANDRALGFAVDAATRQDRDAMRRVVLEAGRLNPALAPGQWRYAKQDVTIGGTRIPMGATVMVSTMSAMRDRRAYHAPGRFDPDTGNDAALVFGHATHRCLGARLATEIITEIFMPLFGQPGLRRAADQFGRMQRVGYFPQRLDVEYDSPAARQTMALAAFPLDRETRQTVAMLLAELGNPAVAEVRASLDGSELVHFASATIVDAADEAFPARPHLLLELNVDGPRDAAVLAIQAAGGSWLERLVRAAAPGDGRTIDAILEDYWIDLHFRPWGATGLNFFGTGDFPVRMIARQHRLRERAVALVARQLAEQPGHGAMETLAAVRRGLRADPADAELDAFLVQPLRKELALSRWRKPASYWAPLRQVLAAGLSRTLAVVFAATIAGYMIGTHYALSPAVLSLATVGHDLTRLNRWLAAPQWADIPTILANGCFLLLVAVLAAALTWAALGGGAYWLLRRTEDSEPAEDTASTRAHMAAIAALEDAPGQLQNHITAVTPLKRGILRRLTLAFALWGIRQSLFWFRPGYVVTMGTIHYAKWFRLPGSDKLIFQSNYDGSWESYLEDFITRAHPGQTAAWSNGVGFPRTKGLIGDGARDGDRFKRWVRRQQVPTSFWYSRFPQLTADHTRNAALLHDGLARAQTDTAARAWLDLIGSAQRQPYELESAEIQSLVFRGLKRMPYTACIPLTLPRTGAQRSDWLEQLSVARPGCLHLTFGKFPDKNGALYLALAPAGLERIGREGDTTETPLPLLDAFPAAFAMGMANRGRVLGDQTDPAAAPWRWSDAHRAAPMPDAGPVAEAVLILYAPTVAGLDAAIADQCALLAACEGAVVHGPIRTVNLGAGGTIPAPGTNADSYEHFRFRDGLTTPVIRGTEQFTPRHHPRDLVEPGEIILGYRNNQEYFAPAILVDAGTDTADMLPIAADATSFGFADFQHADEQFAPRDFGRNGTFLVLRQLDQDVAGFDAFTQAQAAELNRRYGERPLRELVGDTVTHEWVAAKLMGRWRDGRPLVGNPTFENLFGDKVPDNDFAYGRDDPRGHACPLGAHVRRANPRDSREPDDPLEQTITARHLMIRRGRTYFYDPANRDYPVAAPAADAERGLLFTALCADLERQFEMVHQSWLGSSAFHGLDREPDPITTRGGAPADRRYTIPTVAGPIVLTGLPDFVTLRGGGYFFLPSRAAINYLANLSRNRTVDQFLASG